MTASAKLAVVTGGSSGIGRECVLALAETGWDVAFSHQTDALSANDLVAEIEAHGRHGWGDRCDAGISDEVEAFLDSVAARFDRVPDLLVNNAGVQTWSPLLDLAEGDWDRVIRTNLKGCFLNTQKVARQMIAARRGGVIVNIGSGCNKVPFPNLVDYSASKAGIEQFTRSAAMELGPHGIRVNCVAPGAIEVERTRKEQGDYADTWLRITPMRRVGTTRDVTNAVLFLAEDRSDFITAQTLYVDGGVFTVPNWPYVGNPQLGPISTRALKPRAGA